MSKTKTVTVRVTEDFRKRVDTMREAYFAQMPMNTFMAYLAGIGLRVEENRFLGKSGEKMYQDDIGEEEASRDFFELFETVREMNPEITNWTEYASEKSSSGYLEMRNKLIQAIKDEKLKGPWENIPITLKDFKNFKDQMKNEIIDTIREELQNSNSVKEGS